MASVPIPRAIAVGVRELAAMCALLLAAAGGVEASAQDRFDFAGSAMGTGYDVQVAFPPAGLARTAIGRRVHDVLERVDALMSTYRSDSELQRFNRARTTAWIPVSPETVRVTLGALDVARRSRGAFDPTIGPLVELWGFGPNASNRPAPTTVQVAALRARVGFDNLEARREPPALRKRRSEVELDFSGIAKGFAVDEIVSRLAALGVTNALVEIGGEIRGIGRSARGEPWTVAVEDPPSLGRGRPVRVALEDFAIATSGPYRNFRVLDGRRLSHLLDPRTGAPVASDLIAVSVMAPTAAEADAWSTALLVAGPDAGWELAERERLAALFVRVRDGASERRLTQPFRERRTSNAASIGIATEPPTDPSTEGSTEATEESK